jgi:Leucine Rich repeat
MQALAHLIVSGNSITSVGVQALCEGAAKNASLASIHLDHNDLREAGLRAVLHCLERNAGIVYMRVDNTHSPEPLRIAIAMLLEARREH